MSMFNVPLYASVLCYSSISIYISLLYLYILLNLATAVISLSAFASTATANTSGFVAYIGAPVKIPSNSSIILFRSKKHCNLILLVFYGQFNEPFYHLYPYSIYLKNLNSGFLAILLLGLTHSSMFQCIYNLQSFQFQLEVCRFLLVLSYFSCVFLLRFYFLSGGRFLLIFSCTKRRQYLTIATIDLYPD